MTGTVPGISGMMRGMREARVPARAQIARAYGKEVDARRGGRTDGTDSEVRTMKYHTGITVKRERTGVQTVRAAMGESRRDDENPFGERESMI